MLTDETKKLVEKVCDYLQMHQEVKKSDCILVLGSYDERVAVRGAELFLQGLAPLLIFSGGWGAFAKEHWHEAEADHFAKIAISLGVPKEKIIIENKSLNTGENIIFTKELLAEKGLNPNSFIVVQKPYMERRSYATFMNFWPGKEVWVTSPEISLDEYPTADISLERVINSLVGDLQRIKLYPAKGYQIDQEIPQDIWNAYERLVELGYNKRLAKD